MHDLQETIAAEATPAGFGGIGIIRISGPKALAIAKVIVRRAELPVRQALFGNFYDAAQAPLDHGITIFFKAPHSFTGEDVVELQCHGGYAAIKLLLERVLSLGARLAHPGEFTERAFLNGKIDLTQAEAVADLISAKSEQAARSAAQSLHGVFAAAVDHLKQEIVALRAELEGSIDFVEEEEFSLPRTQQWLRSKLEPLRVELADLVHRTRAGVLIQQGIRVVLAGATNAGKSSLFNQLKGENAAIVTAIPGTTRDVLREQINLDGLLIELADTAGFNDAPDLIEAEGIRRTQQELTRATIVLLVIDGNAEVKIPAMPQDAQLIIVHNKIDLTGEQARLVSGKTLEVYLAANTGEGLEYLRQALKSVLVQHNVAGEFSARERHLTALLAIEEILRTLISEDLMPECAAEELRVIQKKLGEITGEVTTDELLDEIFSKFCIGK